MQIKAKPNPLAGFFGAKRKKLELPPTLPFYSGAAVVQGFFGSHIHQFPYCNFSRLIHG
jgi:hypothetical protein